MLMSLKATGCDSQYMKKVFEKKMELEKQRRTRLQKVDKDGKPIPRRTPSGNGVAKERRSSTTTSASASSTPQPRRVKKIVSSSSSTSSSQQQKKKASASSSSSVKKPAAPPKMIGGSSTTMVDNDDLTHSSYNNQEDELLKGSCHSTTSFTSMGDSMHRSSHHRDVNTTVRFKHTMLVDKTWEQVRTQLPDYKDVFGEFVILRMMELDVNARSSMKITSMRGSRVNELIDFIDMIMGFMVVVAGPDSEEFTEEYLDLGKQCVAQGIDPWLLTHAVPDAVAHVLNAAENPELVFTEDDKTAWQCVVDFCASQMQPASAAVVPDDENDADEFG